MSPTERLEQPFIEKALDGEVAGKRADRDEPSELDRESGQ